MDLETPGFLEALSVVSAANTASFLSRELRAHSLVSLLALRNSPDQLRQLCSTELGKQEKDLATVTRAYLYLFAIFSQSRGAPIDAEFMSLARSSGLPWIHDVLAIRDHEEKRPVSTIVMVEATASPITPSRGNVATSWSKSTS